MPSVALALTQAEADNEQTIDAWVARNGVTDPATLPTCDATCAALWSEEHDVAIDGSTAGVELLDELEALEETSGVIPKPPTAGPILLAVTASFTGGFLIGSYVNKKWLHIGLDAPAPAVGSWFVSSPKAHLVPKGATWFAGALAGPPYTVSRTAPETGFYLQSSVNNSRAHGTVAYEEYDPANHCGSAVTSEPSVGGAWSMMSPVTVQCQPYSILYSIGSVSYFESIGKAEDHGAPVDDDGTHTGGSASCANNICTLPSPNANPTLTQIQSAVRTALNSSDYPTLNGWLTHHLGGPDENPVVEHVTMPDCKGETFEQCELKLRELGFNASSIQHETLQPGQVDLGEGGGAVTGVDPFPGSALDTSSEVTIYTNPPAEDMPSPTAAEASLAEVLEEQNASVDDANALDIARACLEGEDEIDGGSEEECQSTPIFVTGADVREATDHDLDAIVDHPEWFRLTRDVTNKSGSGWYQNQYPCTATPSTDQCDEYPFFSSQQGGPNQVVAPSLRNIIARDNTMQGSRLSGFYSTCGVAAPGGVFLVAPIPRGIGLPSLSVCNASG